MRDASGAAVFESQEQRCGVGETFRLDIALDDDVVRRHRAKARPLRNQPGPLIREENFQELSGAWALLGESGVPLRHGAFQRSWICPLPPLAKIPDLVRNAFDVLDGDPEAVQHFRDQLDQMDHRIPAMDRSAERRSVSQLQSQPGLLYDESSWMPIHRALERQRSAGLRGSSSLVPIDSMLALQTAAILAGKDPADAHRNVSIILRQLCPIARFEPILRAAQGALRGDFGALPRFERGLRTFWGGGCGPDDGPLPPFPEPTPQPFPEPRPCPIPWPPNPVESELPDHPWILERWACQVEILAVLREQLAYRYTIANISPPNACEGETIVITGTGFGTASGSVHFPRAGGGPVAATPSSWSDTQIVVVVPPDATTGTIQIRIYVKTLVACGRTFDIFKMSLSPFTFEGGSTRVSSLILQGVSADDWVSPGVTITLRWSTSNASSVDVDARSNLGDVLLDELGAEPVGVRSVVLPAWPTSRDVTVRVHAHGRCGHHTLIRTVRVQRPFALAIQGFELTQAIQHYEAAQHLTDVNDRGADNSLRLVTNKPALLRVYLRSGQIDAFDGGNLANVNGTLTVSRRVGGIWSNVATIASLNGPLTVPNDFPSYDAERGNINSTLNFRVPAATMTGLLRMRVAVSSPDAYVGGEDSLAQDFLVDLQQTLNVRAVAIGYDGPQLPPGMGNVTFAAPTNAQITTDLGFTLATYPVSSTPTVTVIANGTATAPLNGVVPAGGCDPAWGAIMALVGNARTNDGNLANAVYYGWVTRNIPRSHGNVGCSGANAAGLIGNQDTLAHELGHQFGLAHAPCGAVGSVNGAFPLYEPYDPGTTVVNAAGNTVWQSASTGEYGVDVATLAVFNPQTANDFMSYCGPRWISVFTHDFLINQARLGPMTLPAGAAEGVSIGMGMDQQAESPQRLLTLMGTVDKGGNVQVESVSRVEAWLPPAGGPKTELVAELLDEKGEALGRSPLFAQLPHGGERGCGCSDAEPFEPPYRFLAVLPGQVRGATLRIRLGQTELWRREGPQKVPCIDETQATLQENGVLLRWTADCDGPSAPEVWLRWSADGKEWNGLAVGIRGSEYLVPLGAMRAERAWFEVRLHDGFDTVESRVGPVDIPQRAPVLAILNPAPHARFRSGSIYLQGVIVDAGSTGLDKSQVEWTLNGKRVAEGLESDLSVGVGSHELVLQAPGTDPVSVSFDVAE